MSNETVTLRRVGNWILEWDSTQPRTVIAHGEYMKINVMATNGIMYEDGTFAWEYPERLPARVRNAAPQFIRKCQGKRVTR